MCSRLHSPSHYAVAYLTRREYSRQELLRKLLAKGIDKSVAAATIAQLAEKGWQSDERFAQNLVRYRSGRGYGPLAIRVELEQRGVANDVIVSALADCEVDWSAVATRLIAQKIMCGESSLSQQMSPKAWRLLLRRGFERSCIHSVIIALSEHHD